MQIGGHAFSWVWNMSWDHLPAITKNTTKKSCLLVRQLSAASHQRPRDLKKFSNFVGVKFNAIVTYYITGTTVCVRYLMCQWLALKRSVSNSILFTTPCTLFRAMTGPISKSVGTTNFVRSGIAQRDGNRHMRENVSGAVLKALAASTPKRRPRDVPRPPIPAGIQDEIRLKNRLRRQWQFTRDRCESRSQPPAEVRDSPFQRVEKRPVERYTRIPRSWRLIAVEDDQAGDESSYSVSPPGHPRGNRPLRLWESRSPCRQSGGSVSGGNWSFGPGSYWDGWRGAEVLLLKPCQRTPVNHPWRGSRSHQGSRG